MKKLLFLILTMSLLMNYSCKEGKQTNNPFFSDFTTPFQVPPFDKIDTTHYLPAFIEGMKQQNQEIEAIVQNSAVPDFDNTILPFDKSGLLLHRVGSVFFNIKEANTNDQIQAIARQVSPMLSKHHDEIMMNEKLFAKIKAVYENRNNSKLDASQIRVVEKYYKDFERNGANLSKEDQEKLKKINEELSTLGISFGENLLAETNENFSLVIDKKEDLEGLPQDVIDGAAEMAKEKKMEGKWVFGLSRASMTPFLQYAKNRDLREKIYRAYFMRGNNDNKNDNKEIAAKIAKLSCEKAKLLGFKNFSSYVIEVNMAKTPEKVDEFLMKIWTPALQVAKNELKEMQDIIDKEGGKFKLQSWDWWYYAEKLRKAKYDLDESELKPYFSLANVRQGMFDVANKLYGITFTQLKDLPVYHPEVETFEVKDKDGSHLGILYLDYHPRDSKGGGAWCTAFRNAGWRDGKKVDPIVSIVCNVTKPTAELPSLLTWDETETLFHEFGHALHSLFTVGKYDRTAGDVPQDYVELPSQIMENWAGEPAVLKSYAKHYKTGEIIPDNLVDKIEKSSLFNQGFANVEYIAASLLDLAYYNIPEAVMLNTEEFEKNAMDKIGLIPEILPRYRTTYFSHIFDGGYAAGYYVYKWAEVLDADAFAAFKESGDIYNQDLADKFRKYCLSEVGDGEGMDQYKLFRGKDPSVDALLKRSGLMTEKK
ncbi:MAG: M3 family metallopeptidase [Bacteroidales bacterium]